MHISYISQRGTLPASCTSMRNSRRWAQRARLRRRRSRGHHQSARDWAWAAGVSRPGGHLNLSCCVRGRNQNRLATTSTGKREIKVARRLYMHNLIIRTEGDSLKATTLAKRPLCMSPEGLVRQRTSGKRQLYARAVFQADPLAVMTKLLSGSRTLSRGVRV